MATKHFEKHIREKHLEELRRTPKEFVFEKATDTPSQDESFEAEQKREEWDAKGGRLHTDNYLTASDKKRKVEKQRNEALRNAAAIGSISIATQAFINERAAAINSIMAQFDDKIASLSYAIEIHDQERQELRETCKPERLKRLKELRKELEKEEQNPEERAELRKEYLKLRAEMMEDLEAKGYTKEKLEELMESLPPEKRKEIEEAKELYRRLQEEEKLLQQKAEEIKEEIGKEEQKENPDQDRLSELKADHKEVSSLLTDLRNKLTNCNDRLCSIEEHEKNESLREDLETLHKLLWTSDQEEDVNLLRAMGREELKEVLSTEIGLSIHQGTLSREEFEKYIQSKEASLTPYQQILIDGIKTSLEIKELQNTLSTLKNDIGELELKTQEVVNKQEAIERAIADSGVNNRHAFLKHAYQDYTDKALSLKDYFNPLALGAKILDKGFHIANATGAFDSLESIVNDGKGNPVYLDFDQHGYYTLINGERQDITDPEQVLEPDYQAWVEKKPCANECAYGQTLEEGAEDLLAYLTKMKRQMKNFSTGEVVEKYQKLTAEKKEDLSDQQKNLKEVQEKILDQAKQGHLSRETIEAIKEQSNDDFAKKIENAFKESRREIELAASKISAPDHREIIEQRTTTAKSAAEELGEGKTEIGATPLAINQHFASAHGNPMKQPLTPPEFDPNGTEFKVTT